MEEQSAREIQGELGLGERLLWAGQPRPGVLFRRSDFLMIPMGCFFLAFSLFWELNALQIPVGNAGQIFPIFGIPFILVGLYLVVGRFFLDAALRKNTFYGLSNERIILLTRFFGKRLTSLPLERLDEIELEENADGCGSVRFGKANPLLNLYEGTPWPGMASRVNRFVLIEGAKGVHQQIVDALKRLRGA